MNHLATVAFTVNEASVGECERSDSRRSSEVRLWTPPTQAAANGSSTCVQKGLSSSAPAQLTALLNPTEVKVGGAAARRARGSECPADPQQRDAPTPEAGQSPLWFVKQAVGYRPAKYGTAAKNSGSSDGEPAARVTSEFVRGTPFPMHTALRFAKQWTFATPSRRLRVKSGRPGKNRGAVGDQSVNDGAPEGSCDDVTRYSTDRLDYFLFLWKSLTSHVLRDSRATQSRDRAARVGCVDAELPAGPAEHSPRRLFFFPTLLWKTARKSMAMGSTHEFEGNASGARLSIGPMPVTKYYQISVILLVNIVDEEEDGSAAADRGCEEGRPPEENCNGGAVRNGRGTMAPDGAEGIDDTLEEFWKTHSLKRRRLQALLNDVSLALLSGTPIQLVPGGSSSGGRACRRPRGSGASGGLGSTDSRAGLPRNVSLPAKTNPIHSDRSLSQSCVEDCLHSAPPPYVDMHESPLNVPAIPSYLLSRSRTSTSTSAASSSSLDDPRPSQLQRVPEAIPVGISIASEEERRKVLEDHGVESTGGTKGELLWLYFQMLVEVVTYSNAVCTNAGSEPSAVLVTDSVLSALFPPGLFLNAAHIEVGAFDVNTQDVTSYVTVDPLTLPSAVAAVESMQKRTPILPDEHVTTERSAASTILPGHDNDATAKSNAPFDSGRQIQTIAEVEAGRPVQLEREVLPEASPADRGMLAPTSACAGVDRLMRTLQRAAEQWHSQQCDLLRTLFGGQQSKREMDPRRKPPRTEKGVVLAVAPADAHACDRAAILEGLIRRAKRISPDVGEETIHGAVGEELLQWLVQCVEEGLELHREAWGVSHRVGVATCDGGTEPASETTAPKGNVAYVSLQAEVDVDVVLSGAFACIEPLNRFMCLHAHLDGSQEVLAEKPGPTAGGSAEERELPTSEAATTSHRRGEAVIPGRSRRHTILRDALAAALKAGASAPIWKSHVLLRGRDGATDAAPVMLLFSQCHLRHIEALMGQTEEGLSQELQRVNAGIRQLECFTELVTEQLPAFLAGAARIAVRERSQREALEALVASTAPYDPDDAEPAGEVCVCDGSGDVVEKGAEEDEAPSSGMRRRESNGVSSDATETGTSSSRFEAEKEVETINAKATCAPPPAPPSISLVSGMRSTSRRSVETDCSRGRTRQRNPSPPRVSLPVKATRTQQRQALAAVTVNPPPSRKKTTKKGPHLPAVDKDGSALNQRVRIAGTVAVALLLLISVLAPMYA